MRVRFFKKSGHKFFEFIDEGVTRSVCVDGWINSNVCPGFCKPLLVDGWEPLGDDGFMTCTVASTSFILSCPTCFGYVSSRGAYRKVGPYHTNLILNKTGLSQFLYNYTIF